MLVSTLPFETPSLILLFIPSRDQMLARRNELYAEHRCHPWLTMLIPPLTQLPLFVGSSMFLSRLSQPPTVFDSESFLTLTSLSHADPTAALPIALGLITLMNVESSSSIRWFASAEAREREELEEKRTAEKRAQGDIVLRPQKIVQSALRLLSVGRILIGALVPGVRTPILPLFIFHYA
jgi:inner membrane protein COX18